MLSLGVSLPLKGHVFCGTQCSGIYYFHASPFSYHVGKDAGALGQLPNPPVTHSKEKKKLGIKSTFNRQKIPSYQKKKRRKYKYRGLISLASDWVID